MRIIPAIDIIEGKCVRLTKGDYSTKVIYNEDPFEVAQQFEDHGIEYLHMVDLDGARSNKIWNYKILEKIAVKTRLKIDFGGGIKSDEDIKIAFNSGASQVTGGSIAVKNPDLFLSWLKKYGNNKLILGADVKGDKIAVSGWQEDSKLEIMAFIQDYVSKDVKYIISTDIAKDGMLNGPSVELYKKILNKFPEINLIASGGVNVLDDLKEVKLIGCEGVIIGKAIYENKISLKELEQFILDN
ncbi:MAG: 1-(5-phosphoribosyl)-5-[(5-phosphoribosylamino)methylideneamino]imidazole-4-carboxamide isomerase [Flavobacteriia bacterium]|nr:MAG: 1-(5-phosphoribosyl)-5-[(5-phosphoribosylamino)methylideneamino]imidazole-4-carboxamide isomerase [Flavobacteriia bacterium]